MATFKKRLSTKSEKNSDKKEVLIRLRHGKSIEIYAKSHIFIHPKFFSEKEGDIVIKSRIFTDEVREANQLKSHLDTLVNHIAGEFQNSPKDTVSSKWMQEVIDKFPWPEQYAKRAFILWANNQGHTNNDPFRKYSIGAEVYGKPIYITAEERDRIYSTDLSKSPMLERQRDVFIFQCLTGCRVSDLYRLNKDSIGSDPRGIYIHYIPHKTIEDNPQTVKVYLNDKAQEILNKYRDKFKDTQDILPLISQQKYNDSIKEVFRACGIDRTVPVLNPVTGQTEHKSIADIASSHMARRTFVGNLYKKVKDPNLVGKLSGHKEGSRAFARYRDIDDDMIKEMSDLL